MQNNRLYSGYKKPRWAPPAWIFAPVWSVLYVLMALSYGYTIYMYAVGRIPFLIALPFILNLICNIAFTPIQFGLRNFALATADIFLVFATLAWALWAVYPYAAWVSFVNLPYLAWVCFATILQVAVAAMNRNAA